MVKKQQMRWSQRGAHLLLQIRTRVLNGDWEDDVSPVVSGIPGVHSPRGSLRTTTSPRPSWACLKALAAHQSDSTMRHRPVQVSLFRVYFPAA